jgi:hypothetical protein
VCGSNRCVDLFKSDLLKAPDETAPWVTSIPGPGQEIFAF